MHVLVSLCNRTIHQNHPRRDIFLVKLDLPCGAIIPVELPTHVREGSTGAMGLTRRPGGYIALLQPNTLVYLDRALNVESVVRLAGAADAHSVGYYRGAAYVVSTGTDQILRVTDQGAVDVFWEASPTGTDTVHMNSLMWYHDECLISAFGPKAGVLWSSAQNGYAFNITTGEYVLRDLYHPHSLLAVGNDFWLCESARIAVVNSRGLRFEAPWGYLRGLVDHGSFLYVGSTIGRNRSKSTGQLLIDNQADPGIRSGVCGIGILELTNHGQLVLGFRDLSWYAEEIYDILRCD